MCYTDALLQRFEITKDFVKFEKKYLQSDAYKRSVAAGRPLINEFATVAQRDPNKGFFSRMVSTLVRFCCCAMISFNCNIN